MLEPTTMSGNDAILLWLFIAAVIHILIIMGMDFTPPEPEKINRSIEITIVNTPAKKAPKNANVLAQENQVGAGEQTAKPLPPEQKIASEGSSTEKQIKRSEPEVSRARTVKKVLTQPHSEKRIAAEAVRPDMDSKPSAAEHVESRPQLSPELLRQQITQLGTEIRHSRESGDKSRIKFVHMVSAHKYIAAQYLKDWEEKVERMGNRNYPEAAAKKNFSATLAMDVGIKVDGSIYSMRISRSSGIPELDEAAKNIVRMSAPFAPLPLELQKELSVLVITRIWKFSDESGMTAR
ncbi:MAG: TonB family protein [Gammaproteobacteria bacterium]